MKKITLLAFSLLIVMITKAQFTAGDKYLSGTFSAFYSKNIQGQDQKNLFLAFSPSIMKFKTDKKATGFRLSVGYSELKYRTSPINFNKTDQVTASAGVFSQNIVPLGKNFYFFIQKGIDANFSWSKNLDEAFAMNSTKITGFGASLYLDPGIGYKITDRLITNVTFTRFVGLSYQHQVTKTTSGSNVTTEKGDAIGLFSGLGNASLGNLGLTFGWRLK